MNSSNFEPVLYWANGCQMIALNFQMPGLTCLFLVHISIDVRHRQIVRCISMLADLQPTDSKRSLFAKSITCERADLSLISRSSRCGYVLMPQSIHSFKPSTKFPVMPMDLSMRVIAVRHARTNQAKSISKVIIKSTVVNKQKSTEHFTCQSRVKDGNFFRSTQNVIFDSFSEHQWTMWHLER